MKSKSKKKKLPKTGKLAKKKKPAPRIAKKKKMPNRITPISDPGETVEADATAITVVVDESGSMASLIDATCAGFNEYVDSAKRDLKGKTFFSALTFNTNGIRALQKSVPIRDAHHLQANFNYTPGGGTPLLDAVGAAITATDSVVVAEGITKPIVVIQTDGQENASLKVTLGALKVMIEERQARGWQFVFIGAGINAFADASAMGIHTLNTMSYGADAASTRATFNAMAANTTGYTSGATADMNFSLDQSAASNEPSHIIAAKLKAKEKLGMKNP